MRHRARTIHATRHALSRAARGDRGVALPMSLMTLLLLSSLSVALVSLAQTEPTIASNHLRAAQARALAESGIERAIWALTHATAPDAFGGTGVPPDVTPGATPAPPYDGSSFIAIGAAGGFHLAVSGADPNLRIARAIGWTPTSDPGDPRVKSKSEIVATLVRARNLAREATCALCIGSGLSLAGSVVDARGSETTDCGGKVGVATAGALASDGSTRIWGAGAPAGPPALEGRDWQQNQSFAFLLSPDDLDTLKALAVQRGTYLRPASSARLDPVGVPSGIVFVDTPAGTNAVTTTNLATVGVGPDFAAGGPFRGWLVVNGDVVLAGGADVEGMVYAVNGISTEGPASVSGLLIARLALGAGNLELAALGVRFDCAAARATALLPAGWFVRPGTYCDGTAGC